MVPDQGEGRRRTLPAASFKGTLRQTLQRANQVLTNIGGQAVPLLGDACISDLVYTVDKRASRVNQHGTVIGSEVLLAMRLCSRRNTCRLHMPC